MDKLSNGMPGKTGRNASIQGGPSGARTRDLRIKRPSYDTDAAPCFAVERHASVSSWTTGEPGKSGRGTKPVDPGLRYIGNTVLAASLLHGWRTRATARAADVLGRVGR